MGVAYRGLITNEDYQLTARIPHRLTGWSGVDASAPFHGFTIFLDPARRSCILFEVHLRVDDAGAPTQPANATTVTMGKATAFEVSATKGTLTNVKTSFSFANRGDTDDGQVLLVAASQAERKRAQLIYAALVKSIRLGVT